jgi:hypothetical protein
MQIDQFELFTEAGVQSLDISIKQLKSYVFEPKTPALRQSRAKEIVGQPMTVSEKVDGTKLTLVRTSESNSEDYAANWIVSYKGSVLNSSEFSHLTDRDRENIKTNSIGIGQYVWVFDHLKKINDVISSIPTDTEFSVEFAQNKDTLSRTYEKFGDMFLRSFARVKYRIISGQLHTSSVGPEETNPTKLEDMAKRLQVRTFPVYFSGKLTRTDVERSKLLGPKMRNTNWADPLDVLQKFSDAVLTIPSVLGGKIEGVVMKMEDGRFFKVVQSDQYDIDARGAKKDLYRMSPEEMDAYFQKMRKVVSVVLNKIGTEGKSESQIIGQANKVLSRIPIDKFPSNPKRNETQIRDDAHETLRLMVGKRDVIGVGTKIIGLIPIAGKPLHIGHWKLIDRASAECDRVIVYTTSKDRAGKGQFPISGSDFVYFWNDFFIPALPKNVKVRFVDSPVRAVMHELGWFEQAVVKDSEESPTIRLYSDNSDVETNFPDSDLNKFPTLKSAGKMQKVGVERSSTVNISGTKMREFLQNGDMDSFIKYLPPIPMNQKKEIWTTIMKNSTLKEQLDPYRTMANELIESYFSDMMGMIVDDKLICESGQSVASIGPRDEDVKVVDGKPAQATTKLSIVDDDKSIADRVSTDIKEFIKALNGRVHFWKNDTPYIDNGYIFNGSSQHLINPETSPYISQYKPAFGDVDVIVPKSKLDDLKNFLDSIDDNEIKWKPTAANKITPKFYYIGRTKSTRGIPDQVVALWWYVSKNQIVQIDFEGDDMTIDKRGFERPSDWTKFTKDSPYSDLQSGIKGLAGALMIRALARATTRKDDAVVVKPTSAAKITDGQTTITDKDVRIAGGSPDQATGRTINTGGGTPGMRLAYKKVGDVTYNGKPVEAYVKIEPKDAAAADRTTNIAEIFKTFFGKKPTSEELTIFRSFTGLLSLMKKYLDKPTILYAIDKFSRDIASEHLSDIEWAAIYSAIQKILGIKRTPPK